MAAIMCFFLFFAIAALLSSSSSSSNNNNNNPDVVMAVGEMQRADYFAYAMLVNMAPPDLIQANITFLMPTDRALSRANVAENSVTDFLLRHSIPWPLLFEHMEHFPTGSLIPTSHPGFVLKVANDGRRRFFFNNVRVVSPNVCTRGASIRCHGIDGVLQPSLLPDSCPTPPAGNPAPLPHSPPPSRQPPTTFPPPLPPTPTPPPPPAPAHNAAAGNTTHMSPPPSHPPQSVEVDTDDSPPKSGSENPLKMRSGGAVAGVVSFWVMMVCFAL